jgi:GNAT superfamily N-acetyltransferase
MKMFEQNHISTRAFQSSDLIAVKSLVQITIDACYSKVYPKEAVQFFKDWHCDERILKDAKEGYTILLYEDTRIVGTGTIVDNHVMRVFVDPAFQRRGFGKLIMRKLEERAVSTGIDVVKLDASLPSKTFYDSLGYITLERAFLEVENNRRLDFYKMEKALVGRV